MARNPWTGVDALEADELSRIQGFYADALEQAIKNQKKFLKKVADVDSGKIKPPYPEEETEKIKKWREGFVREQLRQQKVIDGIMADINKAGQIAAGTIQDTNVDIYSKSREMQAETLKNESKTWLNKEPNFAMYNKRQIGVLLQKEQSPFSKIAYQNLGQNDAIRRRLQNEMAIAIINGESQEKIMERIRNVVGNAEYNARRTAQTERTRIQAQATHETATEAHAMGIRTYKKWSTRMINSRDNHVALNGACALTNELFKYSADGSEVPYPMMYPADPSAPASEVCNCHCTYIEHVLLDDEDVQFGKIVHVDPEVGKKIAEESLGFEAFNEEVMEELKKIPLFNRYEDNLQGDYRDERVDGEQNIQILNEMAEMYGIVGDVTDPYIKAKIANRVIDEQIEGVGKTKWKGKFIFVDAHSITSLGYKHPDCYIVIPKDADFETIMHELLHARSISKYPRNVIDNIYKKYQRMEEGSVEYLTRYICIDQGLVVSKIPAVEEQVMALENLCAHHKGIKDIDFAKKVFTVPLTERLQFIRNDINILRNGEVQHDGLDTVLWSLRENKNGQIIY